MVDKILLGIENIYYYSIITKFDIQRSCSDIEYMGIFPLSSSYNYIWNIFDNNDSDDFFWTQCHIYKLILLFRKCEFFNFPLLEKEGEIYQC